MPATYHTEPLADPGTGADLLDRSAGGSCELRRLIPRRRRGDLPPSSIALYRRVVRWTCSASALIGIFTLLARAGSALGTLIVRTPFWNWALLCSPRASSGSVTWRLNLPEKFSRSQKFSAWLFSGA